MSLHCVFGEESIHSILLCLTCCSGTGTTLPFRCLEGSYELGSFVGSQVLPDITQKDALGRLWARGTIDANICARRRNDTGRLLGTAFVARDVVEVAKSLGEDDMVRYWGKL